MDKSLFEQQTESYEKLEEAAVTGGFIDKGKAASGSEVPMAQSGGELVTTNNLTAYQRPVSEALQSALAEHEADLYGEVSRELAAGAVFDPSTRTEAEQITRRLGAQDVDFIHSNIDYFRKQDREIQKERYIRMNTGLMDMPEAERAEQIKNLDTFSAERLKNINDYIEVYGQPTRPNPIKAFAKKAAWSYRQGQKTIDVSKRAYEISQMDNLSDAEEHELLKELYDEMRPTLELDSNFATNLIYAGLQTAPYTLKTMFPSLAGAVGGAVLELAAAKVPALRGLKYIPNALKYSGKAARVAGVAKTFEESYDVEAGGMYLELRNMQDSEGNVIDRDTARMAAQAYGVVSAGIEMAATDVAVGLVSRTGNFKKFLLKQEIKKAVKEKTLAQTLKRIGVDMGLNILSEGTEEGLQETAAVFVENRVKSSANKRGASFDLDDYTERVLDAAVGGFEGSVLFSVVGGGIGLGVERTAQRYNSPNMQSKDAAASAIYNKTVLDGIQKNVEALPEIKENPGKYSNFLFQTSQKSLYSDVYMSAEEARAFLNSTEVQNNIDALEKNGILETIRNEASLAEDTGRMVTISFADMAAKIMPYQDVYKSFSGRISTDVDGMTFNAAVDQSNKRKEILERGRELSRQRRGDFETAFEYFQKAFAATNRPAQEIKQYATIHAYVALNFANETGLTIEQVLNERPLRTERSYSGTQTPTSAPAFDGVIAALRDDIRDNEQQNLVEASKTVAKRDVNAIRAALMKRIDNPTDADVQEFISLTNAINELKLNIQNMSDNEIAQAYRDYRSGPSKQENAENAIRDSRKLTGNILNALDPDADLESTANRRFVQAFFAEVVPTGERNALQDKDGRPTAQGIERIENAIVAMIIPDVRFLSILVENPDNNIRRVTSGLAKAAPAIIGFEKDIQTNGYVDEAYSIVGNVNQAVNVMKRAKDKGMSASLFMAQYDMLEEPIDVSTQYFVAMFDQSHSATEFKQKVLDYIRLASVEGDTRQNGLFAMPTKTKAEILRDITGADVFNPAAEEAAEAAKKEADMLQKEKTALAEKKPSPADIKKSKEIFVPAEGTRKQKAEPKQAEQTSVDSRTRTEENVQTKAEPPKSEKISDVGEELFANRRESLKGYTWDDLREMNAALMASEAVKRKIWLQPSYEELINNGMHPLAARILKEVYDGIAAKADIKEQSGKESGKEEYLRQKVQAYVTGVEIVKEKTFKWLENLQSEQSAFLDAVIEENRPVIDKGNPLFNVLEKESLFSLLFPDPQNSRSRMRNKEHRDLAMSIGANRFLGKVQISLSDLKRLAKDIQNGWPFSSGSWGKLMEVKKEPDGSYGLYQKKTFSNTLLQGGFKSREEANKAAEKIYTAYKDKEKEKRAQNKKMKGYEEEITNNVLKDKLRVGLPRRPEGQYVTADGLMQAFGFRGVNFGNWTNQKERQIFLNYTYDSLLDLADILNLPPKALSLDRRLGLAFGAQGKGKAAGHFVPGYNEINLTRKKGAGALAHEWWHAVDHYLSETSDLHVLGFATQVNDNAPGTLRAEIYQDIKNLMDVIRNRPLSKDEFTKRLNSVRESALANVDNYFKQLKQKYPKAALQEIHDSILQDIQNGTVRTDVNENFYPVLFLDVENRLSNAGVKLKKMEDKITLLQVLHSVKRTAEVEKVTSSDYFTSARRLNAEAKGMGAGYWTQSTELGARAFTAYVADKAAEKNMKNLFLADDRGGWMSLRDVTAPEKIYYSPQGQERQEINKAFDKLFQDLKHDVTEKGYRLYQTPVIKNAVNPNFTKEVSEVIAASKEPGHNQKVVTVGVVPRWLSTVAADNGFDITGYTHTVDTSAVRHIFGNHGNAKAETSRGLVPVTKADIQSIPEIVSNPDFVIFGTKNKIGRDGITYVKNMPDGTTVYIEEIRGKRKNLAANTLYKRSGRSDANTLERSLHPTAEPPSASNVVIIDVQTLKVNDGRLFQEDVEFIPYGAFDPVTNTITLFENNNLSTLIHESGHYWLEAFRYFSGKDTASERLIKDWGVLRDWLGIGEDGRITQEQHETFARAIEAYFMTATPPAFKLREVFSKFRRWLTGVYKSADLLDVPLSPEVRAVFDRMVASDAEIMEFNAANEMRSMFNNADEAGMTDADFEKYLEMFKDSSDVSREDYIKAQAEIAHKESTQAFAAARKRISRRVFYEKCDSDVKFRALAAIIYGRYGDVEVPEIQLNKSEIDKVFKPENVKKLPNNSRGKPIYTDNGISLNEAAGLLGVSEAELKSAVFYANRRLADFKHEVNKVTHEEIGDPVSYEETLERLQAAANNDVKKNLLLTELSSLYGKGRKKTSWKNLSAAEIMVRRAQGEDMTKAVDRSTYDQQTLDKIYRDYAYTEIAQKKVGDVKPDQYFKIGQRAGEKALRLMANSDLDGAIRQKEIQIRNFYLQKEAERVKDNIEKTVKRLHQIGKQEVSKAVEQTHQDAARAVLSRFGLVSGTLSQKARERIANLSMWIINQRNNGYDIAIPDSYLLEMASQSYEKLSVDDFFAMADTVKSIVHNGREIQSFELIGRRETKEKLVNELAASFRKFGQIKQSKSAIKPLDERIKKFLRGLDSSLTTLNGLANRIDNADTNGIFHKVFVRPLSEAQNLENYLNKKYADKIYQLIKALPADVKKKMREFIPETKERLGHLYRLEDLITFGLNMGNFDNLDRLKKGNRFTDGQLAWIRNYLSIDIWDFIQNVWDTLDSMHPMLAEHQKQLSGLDMDRVFPIPVRIQDENNVIIKEYKGGYYPIVYDNSAQIEVIRSNSTESTLLDSDYGRPVTSTGYTKARKKGVKAPIKTGFGVLSNHISAVVHDVAYRKTLRDLWNITNTAEFIESFDAAIGKEYRTILNELLKSIGNKTNRENRELQSVDKVLRFFRQRATMMGLAWRVSTILSQPLGLFSSISKITENAHKLGGSHKGSYWIAIGCREVLNPDIRDWAFAVSGELQARLDNNDSSVALRLKELRGESGFKADAEAWSYKAMGYVDYWTALATWIGAYRQATTELNMEHQDAAFYADKTMISSQGSGNIKDTISLQRGGEAYKMLTMFYSFFAGMYQMNNQLVRDAMNIKNKADFINVSARAMALFIVSGTLGALMQGDTPDEDDEESWLAWAGTESLSYALGAYPVIKDITSLKFGSGGKMPYGRALEYMDRFSTAIKKALDEDPSYQQLIKTALNALAVGTGLPIGGQIADTGGYLAAVATDEIRPESFSDILFGLYKGRERDN